MPGWGWCGGEVGVYLQSNTLVAGPVRTRARDAFDRNDARNGLFGNVYILRYRVAVGGGDVNENFLEDRF